MAPFAKRVWLAAALWLFAAEAAWAGMITAELSSTSMAINDAVQLQVTVEGSMDGDLEIPDVDGLIFNKVGHSTQMNLSGGGFTKTVTLMFVVRAQKTGTIQIPSFTAKLDGKKESSIPLTLTVTDAGSSGTAQTQPQQQGGAAAGSSGTPDESQVVKETAGVFLERECPKKDPYVGEQVVCLLRIYHRNNLLGGQRQPESGTDFRRFAMEGEKKYVRQINGKQYGVIELREVLVPLKAGKVTLPAAGLSARIVVQSRRGRAFDRLMDQMRGGMFNMDPFMQDEQEVALQSNTIEMNVKDIPSQGRPASFSGVVGETSVSSQVSAEHIKAGDNITITINVSGNSVLDTLADPTLQFPDIGKVYNDKPEYTETKDPVSGIHSSKTFRVALVPTKPGTHNLGSWEFSYFDPKDASFKTVQANLGTIIVEPSAAEEQLPVAVTPAEQGPQAVKLLGQDMIGPHRGVNPRRAHDVTGEDLWFYLASGGVPLGASLLFAGLSLVMSGRKTDEVVERQSRALRAATQAASQLRSRMKQNPESVGPADVLGVLKQYLGDKSGRKGAAMSSGDMAALIAAHGQAGDQETCKALIASAERIEYGGGAGAGMAASLDDLLGGVESVVKNLDKHWRKS